MARKKFKHVEIEQSTHEKLKLFSQLSNTLMREIADRAINEYIEKHVSNSEKDKLFQDLIKIS